MNRVGRIPFLILLGGALLLPLGARAYALDKQDKQEKDPQDAPAGARAP